ncbi:sugar phosphate isomerase/epimerase family protein [Pseudonocardia sp. HH130630-07]|uniref:sugar phosphate isomerase/epimerase family protein n=1 Tax=Pseudonocardia sp. HH130630-07 TaxID=1690815 RepID=UPI00081519D7|nr:sugar phosphate isomerase/epimerase [Pseudonocardia sp. HH130630-07]ANY05958.1 2-keto-myo-inositol dehydratase [Pseudonocardia sp. HH130630-07]
MARITIGSAPDSWGVWFPSDPEQTPAGRFLAEVAAAGYDWIELGPYGYLPTDPAELSDRLDEHGLRVSAGTVFEHLHRPDSFADVWAQVTDVAALTRATGGEHLVVIPEPWRDHRTGAALESPALDPGAWRRLTGGMDELGRRVSEEYGLRVQFHSHADSHVGHQRDIERFLADTDPRWVGLCLDTGHVAYYRGDNLGLIRRHPDRIGYLHLKQVDPDVLDEVENEDLTFPEAVRRGVMCEPPRGVPPLGPVLDAAAGLGRDLFAIVEQDMYPCPPERPLPIARRTHTFLAGCGAGALDLGRPRG